MTMTMKTETEPFTIRELKIPHDGIIPGAAGHKKVIVSRGTRIYVVCHGQKYFGCGYLYFAEALEVTKNFVATLDPSHKRHMPLETLIQWNFKCVIPTRIHRTKQDLLSGMHGG